jgi:hypothetical protein
VTRVSKLATGYQTPIQADEQQRRILVEPDAPNLSEAEERGTNIQGGHEQDRLPSLKDVVTPGWPASKALSHDDLVEMVAKAFRLSAEDAYAWVIDGESSTLSRGITNIQPTMPTGPDQGAKKGRGQIQVNSGQLMNSLTCPHTCHS